MESKTLKAEQRSTTGTKAARSLRESGLLPGIIYGHGEEPVTFSVDRHEFEVEMLHGRRLLSLDIQGKEESFLVKEVQYDHLGIDPIHLDLTRVDLNETIRVHVSITLRGTPKGAHEGGVLDHLTNEIEVECLASNIPDEIRAHVAELEVGESLTVAALEMPEGVKALADPEKVVATVRVVAEEAPSEEVEEEKSAEPEIITKGKAEDEEDSAEKS